MIAPYFVALIFRPKTYRYKTFSIFLPLPLAAARTEPGPPNPPFTPLLANEVPEGRAPSRPREQFARYKRMVWNLYQKVLVSYISTSYHFAFHTHLHALQCNLCFFCCVAALGKCLCQDL